MTKYEVKNCPAYGLWKPTSTATLEGYCRCVCKLSTKCLTKRVIDKCRNMVANSTDASTNPYSMGIAIAAEQVLQLFEIERKL